MSGNRNIGLCGSVRQRPLRCGLVTVAAPSPSAVTAGREPQTVRNCPPSPTWPTSFCPPWSRSPSRRRRPGSDRRHPACRNCPDNSALQGLLRGLLQAPAGRRRASRGTMTSMGSGFVIDPAGLIVTNNHVVERRRDRSRCTSRTTPMLKAELVGRDPKTDLAVLRVKPAEAAARRGASATATRCGSANG